MTDAQEIPSPEPTRTSDVDEELIKVSSRGMHAIRLLVIGQSVLVLCLIGAVIYLLVGQANATAAAQRAAQQAITASDQRWCATMTLLTLHHVSPPSNPTTNPSREGQYQLYQDFVNLKKEFGCGA